MFAEHGGIGGGGEAKATAHMKIITCILSLISLALCLDQFYMDWTCVNGDLVFNNFSMVEKLVSCFKLYIIGYDALHTSGSEVFGVVCLPGCFIHWFAIAYHHIRNYRTWIRTRILCIIFVSVAGVYLLCRGMVIPTDSVWHIYAVPMVTIVTVLIDGVLLIGKQVKKTGVSEQSLRDLAIKLVETVISIIRLINLKEGTHKPWGVNKILHLVGSGLTVLTGICVIGLMVYNAGIPFLSKLLEWRRKNCRVSAGVKDGNVEEQAAEGGADVELAVLD
ncbi:hypothetical protein ACQ4PT_011938 [Festuca glaucescens]